MKVPPYYYHLKCNTSTVDVTSVCFHLVNSQSPLFGFEKYSPFLGLLLQTKMIIQKYFNLMYLILIESWCFKLSTRFMLTFSSKLLNSWPSRKHNFKSGSTERGRSCTKGKNLTQKCSFSSL